MYELVNMSMCNKTLVILGIGQVTKQVPADLTSCSSHADLAGGASPLAMSDPSNESLAEHIDIIACVRTFANSSPLLSCLFGGFNNSPALWAIGLALTQARSCMRLPVGSHH